MHRELCGGKAAAERQPRKPRVRRAGRKKREKEAGLVEPVVIEPKMPDELSLDQDTITPEDTFKNPSLLIDETVKVVTAATEVPRVDKLTSYISNLFERVNQSPVLERPDVPGSKLNSIQLVMVLTSPARMQCVLNAFNTAKIDSQSFVDVFLQYFKVLQLGTKFEARNVPWTSELKQAVSACVDDMNMSFLPAMIAAVELCGSRADTKYIVRLDAANRSFTNALRAVERAMIAATEQAVPRSLRTRLVSMAWKVMWYLFLFSLLAMIVAFVIFYAQLIYNRFQPIYRRLGDEELLLSALEAYNVPSPIISFIRQVLETNSAPAFWAGVQQRVADTSSWWSVGTRVLGTGWLTLLNAVFNPSGAMFSFVSRWTKLVAWTNLLYYFSGSLSAYIVDPLVKYIAPSGVAWAATSLGLTSLATFTFLSGYSSMFFMQGPRMLWLLAKQVFALGKYTASLIFTTRTITLGYTCDSVVHACMPVTNKDTHGQKYMPLDQCVHTC